MASMVFYSWQLDTPPATGRNFLRAALEDACRALGRDPKIEESHRELTVDSDTQDVAGHPPVVDTILKKIDAASVFVADLTFVAERRDGGRLPNPNVLIEYGWALKALTHERIVLVMNTAYGDPSGEALPFDLRASRWPFQYHLPSDATAEIKAEVKRSVIKHLTGAIRACLKTIVPPETPSNRVPFTDFRAWAFAAGWNGDIRAATIGDNDWLSFTQRLRQAAADGALAFFGRKYLYDFGKEMDSEPLVAIPPGHFDEFGFDIVQLATANNYDIFTGKIGESSASLKGAIFRDLHVTDTQARAWLEGAGKPPAAADIAVRVQTGGAQIGDFKPVCSLVLKNIGQAEFDNCSVEITEITGRPIANMPMPFVLRTASQIRRNERGRFSLLAGQDVVIPLTFYRVQRANEWFFISETEERYFFSADPTKLIARIYGGLSPGNALVFINTDAGWNAMPSVRTVASDVSLYSPDPEIS
jgi:hypothetical protein